MVMPAFRRTLSHVESLNSEYFVGVGDCGCSFASAIFLHNLLCALLYAAAAAASSLMDASSGSLPSRCLNRSHSSRNFSNSSFSLANESVIAFSTASFSTLSIAMVNLYIKI